MPARGKFIQRRRDNKPLSIITDDERPTRRITREFERNVMRVRVVRDIRQRFLRDAVEIDRHFSRQRAQRSIGRQIESNRDVMLRRPLFGEDTQRRAQANRVEHRQAQFRAHLSQLGEQIAHLRAQRAQRFGQRRFIARE